MGEVLIGAVIAAAAAVFYALAIVVQTVAIREVAHTGPPDARMLASVVRRPRWLGGAILAGVGWLLQLGALLLAPLTVVAPVLALSVLILLVAGRIVLSESISRPDLVATVAIVGGVGALAWAAPPRTLAVPTVPALLIVTVALASLSALPWLARAAPGRFAAVSVAGAGFAFALGDLASKLLTDRLSAGAPGSAALWLGVAAIAALLALAAETAALQRVAAVHVAAGAYGVQTVAAVLAAGILGLDRWAASPVGPAGLMAIVVLVAAAAAALARSAAVGAVVESRSG